MKIKLDIFEVRYNIICLRLSVIANIFSITKIRLKILIQAMDFLCYFAWMKTNLNVSYFLEKK